MGLQTIKTKTNYMNNLEVLEYWLKKVNQVLKGRVIKSVRYLNDEEMELMGWYKRPICFELDNGTLCIPSMDDEGNDGGALFTTHPDKSVLPVLR